MDPELNTQEAEVKLANLRLIKGIWPFIRPYRWMLAACCALILLITFLDLLIPWFTRLAIDGFILPMDHRSGIRIFGISIAGFTQFAMIFAAVLILTLVIDFFQAVFMEYTGQKIILNLRCTLFKHMTGLAVPFFDNNTSGRLVSRVAGDVENMNEMFTTILVFIFKDLILMAGVFTALFIMNLKLALYASMIIPVIVISIAVSSVFIRKAFRTIRQKIAEINHMFAETLTGVSVIQTMASEKLFNRKFDRLNTEHFHASMYQIRAFAIFMPFISFLSVVGVAIVIYGGSVEVTRLQLTIGELVAFLFYIKLFFRPLRELSEKFSLLQNALASGERIITILEQEPAPLRRITPGKAALESIRTIEFDRVSFAYTEGQPVLHDISFSLAAGQSIGIVGQTGSGKSTIINLLNGFYIPGAGRILINGIDQGEFSMNDIRQRTAMVMQDPVLFSGTIRDNIQSDLPDVPDDQLAQALKHANCDFLFERHQGIDTLIHEGGRPLSSGEKQLVCIARAFAVNPDLIIFDEATSYMDSQSEIKIHDAVSRLMKSRTSIIIAHRLSTVRDCDTIYLMRDGVIREKGSHDALTRLKGEYYHLLEKEKITVHNQ